VTLGTPLTALVVVVTSVAVSKLSAFMSVLQRIHCAPHRQSPLVAVVAVTLFLGWRFVRRIGGLTGDFLGATEQCAEVAFLLAVAVVRGGGVA